MAWGFFFLFLSTFPCALWDPWFSVLISLAAILQLYLWRRLLPFLQVSPLSFPCCFLTASSTRTQWKKQQVTKHHFLFSVFFFSQVKHLDLVCFHRQSVIPAVSAGFSLMLPFSCLLLTHSCNEGWGEPGDSCSESLRDWGGNKHTKPNSYF